MNLRAGPVAGVMATIATEGRAAFVNAFFVTFVLTIALVPWQPAGPRRVIVSLDEVHRPPVVVPMELPEPTAKPRVASGMVAALQALFDRGVMVPPVHPDAQTWPRGMVIHPPPFADDMTVEIPSALDSMLSGLLAPWLSIAS
jgi:hypothetical protein